MQTVIDPAELRRVLGHFATGVAVITAHDGNEPIGFTCQSLTSVSLEPAYVSFCPAKSSTSWPRLRDIGEVCINVLAAHQRETCLQFAVSGGDKFEGLEWADHGNGAPRLHGALAHIDATVAHEHDAGDHTIVLAEITSLETGDPSDTGDSPLLFFKGKFGTFS
jgi:flavin reductase (DIM6/NTAB) family NADH-FMN oxidoreductase RutF